LRLKKQVATINALAEDVGMTGVHIDTITRLGFRWRSS